MARGAQKAQQARAPESKGDAGQGGAVTATQADAEGEVDWGGANDATRPVAGEGEAGGGVQERLASQIGVETLVLEPPRSGVEGVAEEESAPGAPAEEETCVPEPAGPGTMGLLQR